MSDNRTSRRERGFTLLEVVGAGFVLSVAVLGLTATLAAGNRISESSRDEVAARYAIRSVVAQLEDSSFDVVRSTFDRQGFAISGLQASCADSDGLPGEIEFAPGPSDAPGLYKVIVRARWKGRGGERTIESVHYLGNVRGGPTADQLAGSGGGTDLGGGGLDSGGDTGDTGGTDTGTGDTTGDDTTGNGNGNGNGGTNGNGNGGKNK